MIIIIDFDGTCVKHEFPKVGREIGAAPILKKLVAAGHKLVLFTMRCDHPVDFKMNGNSGIDAPTGQYLTEALDWFKKHNIPLYGVQTNPQQKTWTTSPKAWGDLIIDDTALGIPLTYSIKDLHNGSLKPGAVPFVDWLRVEQLLKGKGII